MRRWTLAFWILLAGTLAVLFLLQFDAVRRLIPYIAKQDAEVAYRVQISILRKMKDLKEAESRWDYFLLDKDPPKFLHIDHERQLVWSVGPDRKNNDALIEYDPTNGVLSVGDVIRRF